MPTCFFHLVRYTKKKYTVDDEDVIHLNYDPRMKKSTHKTMQDYRTAYVKEFYRQFNIKISKTRHQDVIDWMESQDNLVEYIVGLVRKDMLREQKQKGKR